jgi:hypothetical protein
METHTFENGNELSVGIYHDEHLLLEYFEKWVIDRVDNLAGNLKGAVTKDKLDQLDEYTKILKDIEKVKKGPESDETQDNEGPKSYVFTTEGDDIFKAHFDGIEEDS